MASVECSGCRGDKISTVPRVLPEKQCGTERVLPERLARPISQACTRTAWQPEASVLVPWRAPRTKLQKCRVAQDLPRANSRASHAKKHKLLIKFKKISSPIHQGAVTTL